MQLGPYFSGENIRRAPARHARRQPHEPLGPSTFEFAAVAESGRRSVAVKAFETSATTGLTVLEACFSACFGALSADRMLILWESLLRLGASSESWRAAALGE